MNQIATLEARIEQLEEALDDLLSDGPGYLYSWREYEEWLERKDEYRKSLGISPALTPRV